MEKKLNINPDILLKAWKDLGNAEDYTLVVLALAYSVKYSGRLPNNFNAQAHQKAFSYYNTNIHPLLNGGAPGESTVSEGDKAEIINRINVSNLFDVDDRKVLIDMLDMWWGRGKYARTEMMYTQSMCLKRTGVSSEKFSELRKFLKAQGCLTWENKPYKEFNTSYHTFNEGNLLKLLREESL